MSKEDKFIGICILIVTAVIVGSVLWSGHKDNQLIQETTKRIDAEERIKSLGREFDARTAEIDSLKQVKIKLEAVVDYQKKNPSIIIQKYEKERAAIDTLSNSKSFELFSINLDEYLTHKERYLLSRFK